MGRGVKISWVGGSIYTMGRGVINFQNFKKIYINSNKNSKFSKKKFNISKISKNYNFQISFMVCPFHIICLFNIKEERQYKIKSMEILLVSICFNYTYFICQKTMILFTKNRLVHGKGVKVELVIIGVTINFWPDVWDYLIHF